MENEMSESLAARIRECANMVGNGDELSRKTAIPRSTLEAYLTGESEPKASRCAAIAKAAGVSLDWLIAGEGGAQIEGSRLEMDDGEYSFIPLYDAHCTGRGGAWTEGARILTMLAFTRQSLCKHELRPQNLSAVRVIGDSMEGLLSDGDTVLIDHTRNMLEGAGVYVIRLDNHLYPKRLQRQFDGSVHIISQNKAYNDMVVRKDQLTELAIIGRVVWAGGWM